MKNGVYRDRDGRKFKKWRNTGGGACGAISLRQLLMMRDQIPDSTIHRTTTGALSVKMKEELQELRDAIVAHSRDHRLITRAFGRLDFHDRPMKERKCLSQILKDPYYQIDTYEMWVQAMSHPAGYLDSLALIIGAEVLGLDDFAIVREKNGWLYPTVDLNCKHRVHNRTNMIMWDGYGHFEALRKVR